MELDLCWQGPVGPGLFPEDRDALQALSVPGVYLRLKQYAGDRHVAYVGQSRNLLTRFDQHLRDILTFSVSLRDGAGNIVLARDGGNRPLAYNDLDTVLGAVRAEAARMRFIYALCSDGFDEEYLSLVEGTLKSRLEERLGGAFLSVENQQGISRPDFGDDIVLTSDFTGLTPDWSTVLNEILGEEPVRIASKCAGLAHAE